MAADGVPGSPGPRGPEPEMPTSPAGRRWPVWRFAVTAVLAVYSWLLASTAPFTMTSLMAVLLPGAVVAGLAIWGPPGRIEAPARLDVTGFSYWIVCVAALFEWEASAFRDNSQWWHPALTDLVNSLIAPHPLKSLAILLWLLAGWALVRR
jgi:hypothetical protein